MPSVLILVATVERCQVCRTPWLGRALYACDCLRYRRRGWRIQLTVPTKP